MNKKTSLTTLHHLLLGVAIGDAYGAGLEFCDRDWIRKNVDFTRFVNKRTDIPRYINSDGIECDGYYDWEYTDDTEMTIACIKAIISGKKLTEELLQEYWLQEYANDKARKGYGRHGHGSMRWVFSGEKTFQEVQDFQKNRPNPGNGAVMRVLPFCFYPEDEITEKIVLNSNATHPNIHSIVSCLLVAKACYYLVILNGKKSGLIDYLITAVLPYDSEIHKTLETLNDFPTAYDLNEEQFEFLCGKQPIIKPYFPEGLRGLPSDARFTALSVVYVLLHADTAFEGLKMAIRFGGDVDSLASIVTGILAAKNGIDSLPPFMVQHVEGKEYFEKLAKDWCAYLKLKE